MLMNLLEPIGYIPGQCPVEFMQDVTLDFITKFSELERLTDVKECTERLRYIKLGGELAF